jgi:hypothetical protein
MLHHLRSPLPFDNQLPGVLRWSSTGYLLQQGHCTPPNNVRQRRRALRRRALELLQKGHMEDIVNLSFGRKLEPVGNRPNALEHLIGAEELRRELGLGAVTNTLSRVLVQT